VLREAFERARATNLAELVTVVGPAGIGKSRLVRELVGSVANEARVLVGRCLSYGDGITYWPLAEIVREVAGEDIEAGLGAFFAGEEDANAAVTHLVAAVGFGEAPSRSEEIAWAARRLFEVVARDRPLVVIADDIHWAESTLLDLLEYVVGFAGAPILFACLARPDLFDSRPSWALPRPRATTLLLEPLGDEGSWTLVGALLSGAELSESVQEEIVARAEGNPLFVEQMLAHVRDGGNRETKAPPTIQALLTARIDSLEPIERAVMECGAVEGRLFHNGAVASLLEDDQRQGIAGHLVTLVRKELIRPDRAEFLGEDGFRFAHVLVRDAAYASLPKKRRADLHARFATWLEGRVSGRLAEFAEIVGYHLERAYTYRLELGEADEEITDLGNRAGAHFASAGRRALDRGDLPAAIKLLTRAAELRPEAAPERLELAPKLGYALFDSGRPNEARALMADSVEEARRIGSRRLETFVSLFRSKVESMLDPATQAQDVLDEALAAIEEYEPLGDDLVLTAAWENVKDVEWNRGRLTAARAAAGHALAHAERLGDIKLQAEHRTYMVASDYFGLPRIEDCIARCEDFIVWTRANGSLAYEGMGLQALGTLLIEQKRPVEGEELRERGWALFDELGMALTKAGVQGSGAVFRGEFDSDVERLVVRMRSAYETLLAAGEKSLFSTVAANLAQALYLSGDYEGAERLSRESETAGGLDDVTTQVGWRAVRAQVLARRGELSQAEELARDALERALDTEYVALIGEVYESLGEVLLVAGRPEEARAAIQEALETFERKGLLLSADAMRTRLAELQSSGSPSQ
jgi:predicted ATPase